MKFEQRTAIEITEVERNTLKEIIDIVEQIFNIDTSDYPDVLTEVMTGIYVRDDIIHTSKGDIELNIKH